jgi:sugar transferase (PEP-CTERM/EpsH1 system associated)
VRVVHVVASLGTGGLENGVVNIIKESDPARVRHAVVCLEAAGAFAERVRRDVPVIVVGKRAGTDLRALARAARVVRALRPEVVHTRNWATLIEGVVAARLARAKLVHGLHGRTSEELSGEVSWKRRLLEGPLVRSAARVIVLLESLREEALELGVSPERVTVIENGVDLARFHPDPEARARVRAELGAKPKDVVVGCIARLDPVKDHPTLFRAFSKLGDRAILVLVGDGPRRRSLETLARIDGIAARVRFLGHRSDPWALYPAFDLFALASRYEGSSNTVLEALASGVPVVATRTGGNETLVSDRTGVLVPVGDADALGQALARLARDAKARAALSAAGLSFARGRSVERMGHRYEELYEEVARGAPEPVVAPALAPVVVTREAEVARPSDVLS